MMYSGIGFTSERVAVEWERCLHPDSKDLVTRLGAYSATIGAPQPVITAISRARSWYSANGLPVNENSWHLYDCAVDLRVTHYTPEQRALVIKWLEQETAPKKDEGVKKWELVTKLHGTGPHIHLARRDFAWRATYTKKG